MARTLNTNTLAGIYQMISNVSDRVKFSYGSPPDDVANFMLRACVAPNAVGALDAGAILRYIGTNVGSEGLNASQFRFCSTIDRDAPTSNIEDPRILLVRNKLVKGEETKTEFSPVSMRQAIVPNNATEYDACPTSFFLSTMPFVNPIVGRSADAEIFLNYIPSYVASRMAPYLDVEFQFTRPVNENSSVTPRSLATPGLLKFLNGAIQFNVPAKSADDAMALSHQLIRDTDTESVFVNGKTLRQQLDRSYAGMEIFTSPQTLVNFDQLDPSKRYKEILDPLRPFMTLVSLQLEIAPTVGYFLNKTGTMVLKLHDRSRLAEIGDLLQPEIYTRTVMWITYGWKHPVEADNAYASFINNNLLVRELYGIKNASYVFESDGQVTITLQLYTMGATELMDLKITAGADPTTGEPSYDSIEREIEEITRLVAYYANKLGITGADSGNTADIRAYQIINSASRGGEFQNYKDEDVQKALKTLRETLSKNKRVDKADVTGLLDSLKKLYGRDNGKRFDYEAKRKNAIDSVIKQRFKQLTQNDKDPWLPWVVAGQSSKKSPYADNPFDAEIKRAVAGNNLYVIKTDNGSKGESMSGVCSFAKLVATFMAPQVVEAGLCHEFQVFFYAFNESAGLAAGQCIANFPIDVGMFLDQFNLYVQQVGSSKMSVSEFFRFVIDAQLHDYRSLGYGTRDYYKPYKSGEAYTLDESKKDRYEGWMAEHQSKYGPFHVPTIDTYLEMVPLVSDPSEVVDLLEDVALDRSAKDLARASDGSFRKSMKNRYVLRLHVYDKQLNPYKIVETAIKPPSGKPGHMILVSSNEDAIAYAKKNGLDAAAFEETLKKLVNQEAGTQQTIGNVYTPVDLSSNKRVKDYISAVVPSIIFGGNASILSNAQLSTQQNALLCATQMMKQSGRVNPQTPAGAGPGGLPITVIPGQLSFSTLGCPLAQLTQKYFVDFNSGTTADNVYCVSKLSHTFSPGKFETAWSFVWSDAYGRIAGAADLESYMKFIEQQLQNQPPAQQK